MYLSIDLHHMYACKYVDRPRIVPLTFVLDPLREFDMLLIIFIGCQINIPSKSLKKLNK